MKHLLAAAVTLSILAAPAMAAPYGQHPDYSPRPGQSQGHPGQGNWKQGAVKPPAPKPQYTYDGKRYDAYRGPAWKAPKGYNARHKWKRGEKLPKIYRDRVYVIDYRAYRLKAPPRGYQWVRVDRDIYLASMQNGLVSQIVLNFFY